MDVETAAKTIGVTKQVIRRWCKNGKVEAEKGESKRPGTKAQSEESQPATVASDTAKDETTGTASQ